ncbi:MAG: methyltransferase domain-containing protein [Chloroflexi bacterium]|nr:methyltransferase domain-containing protein [Chloroflexota bacterium]
MTTPNLNYDQIASQYNQRYPNSQTWERGQALLELAKQAKSKTILEVGSGTGFWLNLLNQTGAALYGLDYSMGMIRQAMGQPAPLHLSRGLGTQLPYRSSSKHPAFSNRAERWRSSGMTRTKAAPTGTFTTTSIPSTTPTCGVTPLVVPFCSGWNRKGFKTHLRKPSNISATSMLARRY